MASKLFAFNVSRKLENVDEKTVKQWIGNPVARASTGYCTGGQNYGLAGCYTFGEYCSLSQQSGYYLCDSYWFD